MSNPADAKNNRRAALVQRNKAKSKPFKIDKDTIDEMLKGLTNRHNKDGCFHSLRNTCSSVIHFFDVRSFSQRSSESTVMRMIRNIVSGGTTASVEDMLTPKGVGEDKAKCMHRYTPQLV